MVDVDILFCLKVVNDSEEFETRSCIFSGVEGLNIEAVQPVYETKKK